ncbi:MAG: sensor histidine kinase [Methanoregula sp.]
MSDRKIFSLKDRSFSLYLLIAMVVLIVIVVGLVSVNDYYNTKKMFDRNSQHLQQLTEQDIIATIKLTDESYTLYDTSLNDQMRRGFGNVQAEYQRAGGIPSHMDLTKIKSELGDSFDIYIINESGVIEFTTFGPELGMDFKKVPYFFDYLTTIRKSEGFFPDRMVEEQSGSGHLRKFAYMPTPDHRYVLELGLTKNSFPYERSSLQYKKTIERIASANPYIDQIRIFNTWGDLVENVSYEVDAPTQITLEKVLQQRSDLIVSKPETGQSVKYLFIDLKNEQYGSDMSRIVEITYDDTLFTKNAGEHAQFHLLVAILALIIGGCLAFVLSRYLTKPIAGIVRDVDRIADGDLDWKISPPNLKEFQVLEQSINRMVVSLKNAIREVQDEKAFQQEMINHLPVAIFVKNSDDGKFIFWNATSEQMFDRGASDVIGKTAREIFPESMAIAIEAEDHAALTSRAHAKNKKIANARFGERIIHLEKVPVNDSSGAPRYILGVAVDLTEQTAGLKLDLLYSITRSDILDQLAVIMNSLERAQLKTTEDAMQAFFDNTIGSVESIRNQIGFMRALQDLGIVSPKWQHAAAAFENATTLLPVHHIDIQAETDDFEVYADPLLPRVFYNLLENSLRHGGSRMKKIRLSAHIAGDSLHLIYTDDGIGIPFDQKLKIFEFRQVSGTGMGLFLVREMLGFTGITITENGEPGKGVRFEIVVPEGKWRMGE